MLRLTDLSAEDCELVRMWRNQSIENARTPFLLTREMQQDFYRDTVCNRASPHRYWCILGEGGDCAGIAGLTDVDGRRQTAEVALMVDPSLRGQGYGTEALSLLLDKAFGELNLETVLGECYTCNKSLGFWRTAVHKRRGWEVYEPMCQFWDGKWWSSYRFKFFRTPWRETNGGGDLWRERAEKWGRGSTATDPNY